MSTDETFASCEIDDFDSIEFCRTYLKHFGVTIYKDEEEVQKGGRSAFYGLSWKHGFMGDISLVDYGETRAYKVAAIFVFLWKSGVRCESAERLAQRYVGHLGDQ